MEAWFFSFYFLLEILATHQHHSCHRTTTNRASVLQLTTSPDSPAANEPNPTIIDTRSPEPAQQQPEGCITASVRFVAPAANWSFLPPPSSSSPPALWNTTIASCHHMSYHRVCTFFHNYNFAPAVGLMVLLFWFYFACQKKKIKKWVEKKKAGAKIHFAAP